MPSLLLQRTPTIADHPLLIGQILGRIGQKRRQRSRWRNRFRMLKAKFIRRKHLAIEEARGR